LHLRIAPKKLGSFGNLTFASGHRTDGQISAECEIRIADWESSGRARKAVWRNPAGQSWAFPCLPLLRSATEVRVARHRRFIGHEVSAHKSGLIRFDLAGFRRFSRARTNRPHGMLLPMQAWR
jgi:hypothetical protein